MKEQHIYIQEQHICMQEQHIEIHIVLINSLNLTVS